MAAVRKIRDWPKRYKDMYDNILDQKIAHIIQCVDAPKSTLFEIIDKIRKEYPSIDPELVQIIIQGELDRHISTPECTCCRTKAHKKYSNKKECVTTIGTIVIHCPYYVGSSSFGVDLMYIGIKSTPNDERDHEQ